MLDKVQLKKDIRLALENLKFSRAPITEYNVSSVLTSKSGKKYLGVNIESSTLTPSICAERTAFFKAISEGEVDFESIIIVGGKKGNVVDFAPPCGVCRQVMMDHCDPESFLITVAVDEENYETYKLKDLLPLGFGFSNIN